MRFKAITSFFFWLPRLTKSPQCDFNIQRQKDPLNVAVSHVLHQHYLLSLRTSFKGLSIRQIIAAALNFLKLKILLQSVPVR